VRRFAAVALTVLVSACYGGSASPTPGDMVDVLGELSAHGVTMTDTIAGDAGCADQSLVDNARKLQVSFAPDGKTYTVYLFRWLNNADYIEAGSAFDSCAVAYQGAHSGSTITKVDVSPWRAFGPDWTTDLQEAVNGALADAAMGD
jgi:hypothetical protein